MTHAQWHSTLRRSLALVERNTPRALKSLDELVTRLYADAANTVNHWHVEQTLEAMSIVHSRRPPAIRGDDASCRRAA